MSVDERQRLLAENARRRGLDDSRYKPWNPAERLMVDGRRRLAARMLERADVFPGPETPCLEVGFGDGGWLIDLLGFRVRETSLFGAEIDPVRAIGVHKLLPCAHLAVTGGDGLPFRDGAFSIVIASTVFTSILDAGLQEALAAEIVRVTAPGGVVLYYDFAVNNPRNPNVRGVNKRRLRELFAALHGDIKPVTLAPPLLRRIAPFSVGVAELLAQVPGLRTHLLAVLKKPGVLATV